MEEKKGNYYANLFREGFLRGVSWAFGVTVGFAIISTVLIFLLQQAGGLPIVGSFIASLVESTLIQLGNRSPVFRN